MGPDKEVTIYDIARYLDISAATVSRGLNNNPLINVKTRERIVETAKILGYRSNTIASSLRNKRSHTIGVIVPRLDSYFMSKVLAGMENAAIKMGYNLIISQSLEKSEKEKENAHTMYSKRVDGLLVSLAYDTEDYSHFHPFYQKKIPVVFFDRVSPQCETACIVIDNFKAAYDVTTHLIEQGCRRIMHLCGNVLRNVYSERLRGYKQALHDFGIAFEEGLIYNSTLGEKDGYESAEYILNLDEKPDGVFAANDTSAIYCMMRLMEAGVRVPGDIAFAGFNNDPVSKIISPNLTTVNYPGFALGEAAANSLISHIKGNQEVKTNKNVELKYELIIRESSLKKLNKRE
jgi:LacI family transcriptional regulator